MASPFQNPPLLYEGPDPTADYFLSPRTAWNQAATPQPSGTLSAPGWRSVGTEELPPLVAPEPSLPAPMIGPDPFTDPGFVGGGVTDHKDGFFQKVSVTETWLDRPHADDYGLHEIDAFAMFAVPAPSREWPLLISPTFNTRLIDGPVAPDLPSRVYEAFLDLLWVPRLSERWIAIIGVAPSYYGDFKVDDSDAFRMTGKGLARFDWSPGRVQLLFGVLYLNRNDVQILPAGGIIWTPNDAKRYELVFPKPKLAHRITLGDHYEDWVYLGGEFGGNTYAVERVGGALDYITLRDVRVYVGLERKLNGGAGYRIEAGYVMGRRVEYDSATPDVDVDDTAILRAGFTF
jgi:hypothetical protein